MNIVPLRHVAEVRTSSVDKKAQDGEVPVRLCNYMDVYRNDRVHPEMELMVASATPEEVERFRLLAGDSVVTKDSEDPGDIGISAYVDATSADFVCGYHLAIVRPRADVVPRFLNWAIRGREVLAHWSSQASGMTRYGLGLDGIKSAPIHVLDADEQRRIADFLDDQTERIDLIIAARRKQIALTKHLSRRQVLDVFAEIKAPIVKLSTIWTVVDCKHRTPNYVDTGYPVVSPGDVTPGRLDLSRIARFVSEADFLNLAAGMRRCRVGDLVYSRNASAGTAAYVETAEPFTMGQDVCRITSLKANQLYLAYCLNYVCEPQLEALKVGATFMRINVAQIKGLLVPAPSHDSQVMVASRCDEIVEVAARAEDQLTHSIKILSEYKSALISAAVTGEVDVTTAGSGIPA